MVSVLSVVVLLFVFVFFLHFSDLVLVKPDKEEAIIVLVFGPKVHPSLQLLLEIFCFSSS